MRIRCLLCLSMLGFAANGAAYELTGHFYDGATIEIQLGDLCDTTRFPLTPGNCNGNASNPDWEAEFQTAVDRWNTATNHFEITTDPGTGASMPGSCDSDDPSSAFFLDDQCGNAFGGSTLAVARTLSFTSGVAVHSDVIFNTNKDWDAFDDSLANHAGDNDFRRVAVHEVGHVLGISHPFHSDAIMYFASQDVTDPQADDLGALEFRYGLVSYLVADDYTGNGKQELVVVRSKADRTIEAEVRDVDSGVLTRRNFLSSAFTPIDAVLLPDLDGNGGIELAILAKRNSDNRAVVEIRNLTGSSNPRLVWFLKDARPVGMLAVPDADSNGVTELAVLMVRDSDDRALVELRNAFGPVARKTVWFAKFATPVDMTLVNDGDNNNVPEIAVLMSRWSDARGFADIRNAVGAVNQSIVWAGSGLTVEEIAAIDDADSNNVPEVAIRSIRDSDGRNLVEVKNSRGPTAPNTLWFIPGQSARAMTIVDDSDNNNVPEVAVASRRDTDGRILVEAKNAAGATAPQTRWFSSGFSLVPDLHFVDDLDVNNTDEASVLLYRTTDGRMVIERRNISGAVNTQNSWVSP